MILSESGNTISYTVGGVLKEAYKAGQVTGMSAGFPVQQPRPVEKNPPPQKSGGKGYSYAVIDEEVILEEEEEEESEQFYLYLDSYDYDTAQNPRVKLSIGHRVSGSTYAVTTTVTNSSWAYSATNQSGFINKINVGGTARGANNIGAVYNLNRSVSSWAVLGGQLYSSVVKNKPFLYDAEAKARFGLNRLCPFIKPDPSSEYYAQNPLAPFNFKNFRLRISGYKLEYQYYIIINIGVPKAVEIENGNVTNFQYTSFVYRLHNIFSDSRGRFFYPPYLYTPQMQALITYPNYITLDDFLSNDYPVVRTFGYQDGNGLHQLTDIGKDKCVITLPVDVFAHLDPLTLRKSQEYFRDSVPYADRDKDYDEVALNYYPTNLYSYNINVARIKIGSSGLELSPSYYTGI